MVDSLLHLEGVEGAGPKKRQRSSEELSRLEETEET